MVLLPETNFKVDIVPFLKRKSGNKNSARNAISLLV